MNDLLNPDGGRPVSPEAAPQTTKDAVVPPRHNDGTPPGSDLNGQSAHSVLAIIERAAFDPNVEPAKLAQLMDLRDRWRREKAEEAFNAAKGRILVELAGIKIVKNRAVEYKKGEQAFKYAPLEDIDKVLTPLLTREEMDLSYTVDRIEDGRFWLRGRLKHLPSGHYEDSDLPAPLDSSGGKNNVQAVGSTNSYLRRYVACNIFNIVVVGDDDDGNGGPMAEEQAAEILDLIKRAKVGHRFLRYMRWPSIEGETTLESIVSSAPRKDYGKAKVALLEQIAKSEANAKQ